MNLKVLQLQSAHLGALITKATGETSTRGDLVAKLVEEVGELSKASRLHGRRKFGRPDAQPGTADAVLDELGDCLFLLGRLADAHGIDAEMAGERAVAKVIERITTAGAGDRGALIDLPHGDEDDGPPFFWAGAAMDSLEQARELVLAGRLSEAVHLWAAALGKLTIALERSVGGDMHAMIDTKTLPMYVDGYQVLISMDKSLPGWARNEVARGVGDVISSTNRKVSKEEARDEAARAAETALTVGRDRRFGPPQVCHLCAREIKLGPVTVWTPAPNATMYKVHQVCADLVAEGSDPAQVATELEAIGSARADMAASIAIRAGRVTIAGFNGDDLRAAMELEARFNLAECHRRDIAKAINQKGAAAVAAELAADIANMERIKAGGQVEVFLGVDHGGPGAESAYATFSADPPDAAGHRHIRLVANLAAPVGIAQGGPVYTPGRNADDRHQAYEALMGRCWNCLKGFEEPEGCEHCAGKGLAKPVAPPATSRNMAIVLELVRDKKGQPTPVSALLEALHGNMESDLVFDLLDEALKQGVLAGNYEGLTLTDKGRALTGPFADVRVSAPLAPLVLGWGADMRKLITAASEATKPNGDPATMAELVKRMGMDPADVADLVELAIEDRLLFGDPKAVKLTDKGAKLIALAVPAPSYGFGQFKAGQALLWFPMEGRSEYHRVEAIYDIPGTNDCNAYAAVELAGKEINARVSHLLTPEAYAEMIKPAVAWGPNMVRLLAVVDTEPDRPAALGELQDAMGDISGEDVSDLVTIAKENGLLADSRDGFMVTEKGREIALTAPIYGPFTAGQSLLWFPQEGTNRHSLVMVTSDFAGTNDMDARVAVSEDGRRPISARVSHLLTPETWAKITAPKEKDGAAVTAPLAPLALKWGADMKKMLAIVDSEPERRGGVTHAETVAACGWLDGQQVTDLVDLALENALLTGDNQGLKLTDKGREVMTPAFGPFRDGETYMYFPGDWRSPHHKVKVRKDHPATDDVLARVHVIYKGDKITARVLKLMTLAEYAEHFSE